MGKGNKSVVIGWSLAAILALFGCASLFLGSVVPGILLLIAGAIALPLTARMLKRIGIAFSSMTKAILIIILLICAFTTTLMETDTPLVEDTSIPITQDSDNTVPATSFQCVTGETAASEASCPAISTINETMMTGNLRSTITGVSRRVFLGNSEYVTPNDEFLMFEVKIMNIDDAPWTFTGEYLTLLDAKGNEYKPDSEAAIRLGERGLLYEQIAPGVTKMGAIVFDVPKGTNATYLRLRTADDDKIYYVKIT